MKNLKLVLLFVLGISAIISCKKDNDQINPPSTSIAAVYEGKFGTGTNVPSSFFSFKVDANGVLQEVNSTGTVIGKGIWTLTGNTFYGTYHYLPPSNNTYSVKATYDVAAKKFTGTWGYGNNDTNGGDWFMVKKN